ncbi:MAG TPA: hypothetical protein PKL83_06165, partial [bacterium]|nr:hypothetical protein [bacterium]
MHKQQNGFSVLEILLAASILGGTLLVIWSIFLFSLAQVGVARARTIANNIANEKMEIMRNMPYEDLGTTTGHPSGVIPSSEIITRNGMDFTITTIVRFYDSVQDGFSTNIVEGKHIHFEWDSCGWDPGATELLTLNFYNDGVVQNINWQDYYQGQNFNWAGSVTVGGTEQHFHIRTHDVTTCPLLSIQSQNVEKNFKIYVDGFLIGTYLAPDTVIPAGGVWYEVVGQGGPVPADIYPNDYKHVQVTVAWTGYVCPKPVYMSTFIAQRGLETAEATGVLIIEVLDANGVGVPSATIHVVNDAIGMLPFNETT